jgi:hypothetical protein
VQCRRGVGRGRCVGGEHRLVSGCQGQAEKLDSPLSGGACVIGVAVPTAGAGAAKGVVNGSRETRESGGASGAIDEGLGVCEVVVAPGLRSKEKRTACLA